MANPICFGSFTFRLLVILHLSFALLFFFVCGLSLIVTFFALFGDTSQFASIDRFRIDLRHFSLSHFRSFNVRILEPHTHTGPDQNTNIHLSVYTTSDHHHFGSLGSFFVSLSMRFRLHLRSAFVVCSARPNQLTFVSTVHLAVGLLPSSSFSSSSNRTMLHNSFGRFFAFMRL